MAAEFGPAVVNRPAQGEVARPVAAPNYVNMYSERVRAALEPFNYLLNYQKELSEDDLRKAQIQNYLAEHDIKTKELNETVRAHTADETMRNLEFGLNQTKYNEDIRHNKVTEAHADRLADIDQQRANQAEIDEKETERFHRMEDERNKRQEEETKRHNEASEKNLQQETEIRKGAQESEIAERNANAERLKTEAQAKKLEQDNYANDQQVIQEMNEFVAHQRPEDMYGSQDNDAIQQMIDSAYSRVHTVDARHQLDGIIGQSSALGMEIAERRRLHGMGTEAKKAFMDTYINTDPKDHPQNRFNEAMRAATETEARYQEKFKWGTSAQTAYDAAKRAHKSEQEAFQAGQDAQLGFEREMKSKVAPPPKTDTKIFDYGKLIPQREGENDNDYNKRVFKESARLENIKQQQGEDAWQKEIQNYGKTPGSTEQGGTLTPKQWVDETTGATSMLLPAEIKPGVAKSPLASATPITPTAQSGQMPPELAAYLPQQQYSLSDESDELDQALAQHFA